MNDKDSKYIKRIVKEYLGFMRETSRLVEEVKRATILSLQKALELEDGDTVLISGDGSLKIEPKKENGKEKDMPEAKDDESEKLTLNGRGVTAEELQQQREAIENQKGARLDEVSKGNFRLRLND